MARIPSGILGALIGKAGPITGYMRNGENIIRTAAKRKDPKITPPRTAQRKKIKVCHQFTQSFTGTGFFNRTFPAYGERSTGYNRATSALLNLAITGNYPDTHISFPQVLISRGPLPAAMNAIASLNAEDTILFTWENNSGFGTAKENDQVIVVAYFPETMKAVFKIGIATRKDGQALLHLENISGVAAETWIGFLSEDEKDAGDSVYGGRVTIGEDDRSGRLPLAT